MRVVFFGTPAFAAASLERLLDSNHEVLGVVTQPDRPRGRGQKLQPGDVKRLAVERGLPVLQPETLRGQAFRDAIAEFASDIAVVAAYGKILPSWLLALPQHGFINVHASLLPRWRGAAPIHRAVIAGDRETGITIMRVVPALDAGPMLSRESVAIDTDETSEALERRLARVGAGLLVATLDRLATGRIEETPQDEAHVTYAHRLERKDSVVDWDMPASTIHDRIRGLQPWPLAVAMLRGRRLALLRSSVVPVPAGGGPAGTVLALHSDGFDVACGSGAVRILDVQPEGRPAMTASAFLNGRGLSPGDRLDTLPTAG
jgi:methionyl-tRNA formyltransferase